MSAPEDPTSKVREAPGADGAPPSAASIEVDGAGPQPGDGTGVHFRVW
jgi:hypothetical protein